MNGHFKNLLIIFSCVGLIFFNIFSPYFLVSFSKLKEIPVMELGVHYNYSSDSPSQIYVSLKAIKDVGFTTVKIWLEYNIDDINSDINNKTMTFYEQARSLGLKIALVVRYPDIGLRLDRFLDIYSDRLTYVQILNEPETTNAWTPGSLLIDNEIYTYAKDIYDMLKDHNCTAKFYTNFTPAFILRPNIVGYFNNLTDFVGFDAYMDGIIQFTPILTKYLSSIVEGKEIIISEFGMMENDDIVQANHIISNLNFFKSMGFKQCWLCYWGGSELAYNIRGRLAQQAITEWIQAES